MPTTDSVATLLARIGELEAALRPFAFAWLTYTTHDPKRRLIAVRNDGTGEHDIRVADLERAWTAYRNNEKPA